MSREEDHQKTENAYKVVMIQISGFVHQFDVGKTEEENDNCCPILIPDGNEYG